MIGRELLVALVQRCRGASVWAAKQGVGTFATLDLGERVVEESVAGRRRTFGSLHIWLQYCDWRLLSDSTAILSSNSGSEAHGSEWERLVGTKLLEVATQQTGPGVDIVLSGGYRVEVRPCPQEYEDDDDLIVFYEAGRPPMGLTVNDGVYYET